MELSAWHMWFKRRGGSELRALVMEHWDPIGVRDFPEAQDEYDGYLGRIAAGLRSGAGEVAIAQMLSNFSEVNMGIDPNPARDAAAAHAIASWYDAAMATEAHPDVR